LGGLSADLDGKAQSKEAIECCSLFCVLSQSLACPAQHPTYGFLGLLLPVCPQEPWKPVSLPFASPAALEPAKLLISAGFSSSGEFLTCIWSLLDLPYASFLSLVRSLLPSQCLLLLHLLVLLRVGMDCSLGLGAAVLEDQPSLLGCLAPSGPSMVPYLSDQSPEQTVLWLFIVLLVIVTSAGILNSYSVSHHHVKKIDALRNLTLVCPTTLPSQQVRGWLKSLCRAAVCDH